VLAMDSAWFEMAAAGSRCCRRPPRSLCPERQDFFSDFES